MRRIAVLRQIKIRNDAAFSKSIRKGNTIAPNVVAGGMGALGSAGAMAMHRDDVRHCGDKGESCGVGVVFCL